MDRSGSICNDEPVLGCDNWDSVLEFMEGLVDQLETGESVTRFAVIVFGNYAYKLASLTSFTDKENLTSFIRDIEYDPNKGTNTSGGIRMMIEEFNAKSSDEKERIAVIITDGKSTRNTMDTVPAAEEARSHGITIFVVGITDGVHEDELRSMSSTPQELSKNYFTSASFDALAEIEISVSNAICPALTTTPRANPPSGLSTTSGTPVTTATGPPSLGKLCHMEESLQQKQQQQQQQQRRRRRR